MSERVLVLMAHGSKDPRWRAPFEQLEKDMKSALGESRVFLCYMEFVGPGLEEAVGKAVEAGADEVRVLPLFMAGGSHVAEDLPPIVRSTREKFPSIRVELLPPVGEHPEFRDLIRRIAAESIGKKTE